MSEIILYQTKNGAIDVRLEGDTVWLSQQQLVDLLGRDRTVIGRHIRNVFREGELDPVSVCANYAHTAADGKTYQVEHYNLDLIISVGYRVKSLQGVQFRQWATNVLKQHLVQGYTINRQRFETNTRELEAALLLVRKTAAHSEMSADQSRGLVDIIARYAHTFLLLQRYDEGLLTDPHGQPGGLLPSLADTRSAIVALKSELVGRGEAGDLFGRERGDALASVLGNLDQSVFGEPAYPTIESKAAHLLYFIIKNHPFSDGNKRIGALLFIDFLRRNDRLTSPNGEAVINDIGLAALALLVAESDPKDKEILIRLIINMLSRDVK